MGQKRTHAPQQFCRGKAPGVNLKAPIRNSLQLNPGSADDLAPSFAFRSDEGAELFWGVLLRNDADRLEPIRSFLPIFVYLRRSLILSSPALAHASSKLPPGAPPTPIAAKMRSVAMDLLISFTRNFRNLPTGGR
jgi:hypothetical protein